MRLELIFFDAEADTCLDVGVVGGAPRELVVVDFCLEADVVESFAFDVADGVDVALFVDIVDVLEHVR